MSLNAQEKLNSIQKFQRTPTDTGSPEVQIALMSAKISHLTGHLQTHKKDLHSRRGLIRMVNNRRKLLIYIKRTNYSSYVNLIQELGLRK
ncbi:MAG: 30S ribosomal protein S15 [Gammaproteobacteria bacterium]|jgi:small subunit ribosomal protein S15